MYHTQVSNAYHVLVGKTNMKRQLANPSYKCEADVKVYFKETECEEVDQILLVQTHAVIKTVMNPQV